MSNNVLDKMLNYVDEVIPEIIKLEQDLVNIPSVNTGKMPTGNETAVCEYIKKWLPQLKNIPAKQLHNWEENYLFYNLKDLNYVKPIVEYKKAREKSIKMYRSVI